MPDPFSASPALACIIGAPSPKACLSLDKRQRDPLVQELDRVGMAKLGLQAALSTHAPLHRVAPFRSRDQTRSIGATGHRLEGAVTATTRDEGTQLDVLLSSFSESVRSVVSQLGSVKTTVWQLADRLLREYEREHRATGLPSLAQRTGEERAIARWLELVQGLIDRDAVASAGAQVIGTGLMLLGLARLDPGLDDELRKTKVRWRLEDELECPLAEAFWPWALPSGRSEWLQLWELGLWGEMGFPVGQVGGPHFCVFSPDRNVLAIGMGPTVRLLDVAAGTELGSLSGDTGLATSCAFDPNGRVLAVANADGTVRLWDVATGIERAALSGHTHEVIWCSFSPNGRVLATAGRDGNVRLWDGATGSERATLSGHMGVIWRGEFSRDGRLLATASQDMTARVWDIGTGTERALLSGHTDAIGWCAFSPDGNVLATACSDMTARLWDVTARTERTTLRGHTNSVTWCVQPGRANSGDRSRRWDDAVMGRVRRHRARRARRFQ
jgi:hypothetical protein